MAILYVRLLPDEAIEWLPKVDYRDKYYDVNELMEIRTEHFIPVSRPLAVGGSVKVDFVYSTE